LSNDVLAQVSPPALNQNDQSQNAADIRRARIPILIVLVFGVGVLCDSLVHSVDLVTPVPSRIKLPAILIGFGVGAWLAMQVRKLRRLRGQELQGRQLLGVIAIPFLIAPIGSYVGRRAYETAAFSGVLTSTGSIEGVISAIGSKRTQVDLEFGPGYRDLWISTTYRPTYSAIGKFCLNMPVERGKFGALRTRVPAFFDDSIPLERFRPCSPQILERNPELAQRVARIEGRLKD
jgi:hypothetical protein